MPQIIDLTGKTFGRLTVLRRSEYRTRQGTFWHCSCNCDGREVPHPISSIHLRQGNTRSCGCLKVETMRNNRRAYKGGPLYSSKGRTFAEEDFEFSVDTDFDIPSFR